MQINGPLGSGLLVLTTLIIAYLLTFLMRLVSKRLKFLDQPSQRKHQSHAMLTMGGVGIFGAFWLIYPLIPGSSLPKLPLFCASLIILLTGMLDDRFDLSPLQKSFGILLGAGLFTLWGSYQMVSINLPILGFIYFGSWSPLITIVWLYGITNAVNLMDGLDGLAAGICMIALATMASILLLGKGALNLNLFFAIVILAAAIGGFYPHNAYPAKIYMGDTGALFIGFMIAVFTLSGLKNATVITLIIPLVVLGLPLTDTLAAIIRRLVRGESITTADRDHLHHRFMRLGLSHPKTVFALYSITIYLSILAISFQISAYLGIGIFFSSIFLMALVWWIAIRD